MGQTKTPVHITDNLDDSRQNSLSSIRLISQCQGLPSWKDSSEPLNITIQLKLVSLFDGRCMAVCVSSKVGTE